MIEGEVTSGEKLKLTKYNTLKDLSLVYAERMQQVDSKISKRVESCCDSLNFKKFSNGYLKLQKAQFCKVRGCPVCDSIVFSRQKGKIFRCIKASFKSRLKNQVYQFDTTLKSFDDLVKLLNSLSKITQRFLQTKVVYFKGFARLWKVIKVKQGYKVEVILFLAIPLSAYRGRKYLKNKRAKEIWNNSVFKGVPSFFGNVTFNFTRKNITQTSQISVFIWEAFPLYNLNDIDNRNQLSQLYYQLHNRRMFALGGIFMDWEKQREEPQQKKSSLSSSPEFYIYQPDINDPDFSNFYIKRDELAIVDGHLVDDDFIKSSI